MRSRQTQKGITILITLFLFMLLSILALNIAQVMVVDSQVVTETSGGITRQRVGPGKELERLRVFYLAHAGLNHIRKLLIDDPTQVSGEIGYFNDDASQSNSTGRYDVYLVQTSNPDPRHTLTGDLQVVSEVQTPPHNGTGNYNPSTTIQLQKQYWRSARVFADQTYSIFYPVNMIDRSLPTTPGLDQNMGIRNPVNHAPPSPMPPAMDLGSYWEDGRLTTCDGGWCFVHIDFGMDVTFDEIRFLNQRTSWISLIDMWAWDSNGNEVISNYESGTGVAGGRFPEPGRGPFTPYYHAISCSGSPSNDVKKLVYNGDRCTDFLGLTNGNTWLNFNGGSDECSSANACGPTDPTLRSYIARIPFDTPVAGHLPTVPVTARTIDMSFLLKEGTGLPLIVRELGFYCCNPTDPTLKENVFKRTYGVARVGLKYTNDPNPSNRLSPASPNATAPQDDGVLTKSPSSQE